MVVLLLGYPCAVHLHHSPAYGQPRRKPGPKKTDKKQPKKEPPKKKLLKKKGAGKARPSAAVLAEARRRFVRGNNLYRLGNYAEALLAYQAALDLYEEPTILYNIAQTYEKLRDPGRAALLFERYLEARPKAADREAVLKRVKGLKQRARVEVSVTSYPPGAAIYVGSRREGVKGRTPFTLKLPLGKQRIVVELAGFIPEARTVDVELGARNLVDVQLQRKSSIRVDADIPGARTYIDSDTLKQSHRVPHIFEVDPGKHLVRVELGGYQKVKREVEVSAGDQISLLVNLKSLPKYGRLQVEGPRAAAVIVDGRTMAHLPMPPMQMAAGTYRVTVSKDGRRSWESKISVSPNRLTVARVSLMPLRGPVAKSVLYSSVGLSVGAVIAGTVFGVLALRSEREYNALPEQSKLDDGKSQALVADICFAAAGAGVLAAVVTYLATERGPSEAEISFSDTTGQESGQ